MFKNSAGVATSRAVTLTVGHAPQVSAQPTSQSVQSGAGATFTAVAKGDPSPSVQWQVSTDGGSSWAQLDGAVASGYSFTVALSESGYEYRAVFTNRGGSATSAPATLTVTPVPSPPVPSPPTTTAPQVTTQPAGSATTPAATLTVPTPDSLAPQITTQPVDDTVARNATASFTAAASGTPAPAVLWQVSGDGGATWDDMSGATSSTLSLTATSQQRHLYRAVFSNSSGTATSDPATLTIAGQSSNWSGYAVTGTAFTNVSGGWTVPAITCSGATTYSSQWIGIDGYNSSSVEQDGIEADCISGSPYYGAWYEMYGDNAVNSGFEVPLSPSTYPVHPGDSMTASVTVSGSSWTLQILDATHGWSFSVPITWAGGSRISAEWVAERPVVNGGLADLADFGSVSFTGSSATDSQTSGAIFSFPLNPLEMVNGSNVLAVPGALNSTGQSFDVTWYPTS